jgi:Arc/MetJ-type ribon-helix-helix transcriptional regulator
MSQKFVRRGFTFPKDYDAKIERLMKIYGCVSKSELLRVALRKLEDEANK